MEYSIDRDAFAKVYADKLKACATAQPQDYAPSVLADPETVVRKMINYLIDVGKRGAKHDILKANPSMRHAASHFKVSSSKAMRDIAAAWEPFS